jgi:hypothetical protein
MTDSNTYPEDPAGTVRVEHLGRAIAVRGFSDDGEAIWYVIDTSNLGWGDGPTPEIANWPVVFGGEE